MMFRSLLLVAVLVVLAAGCGGDDDDDSGSGGSAGSSSGSANGGASDSVSDLEPTSEECGGDAPKEVAPPAAFDGFVRLCEPEFAQNLLVIWNISNVVIRAQGDAQDPELRVWAAEDNSLATRVINQMGLPHCGQTWCRIRPGGHLRAAGLAPVGSHVYLQWDPDLTGKVALATSVAGAIEGKLKSAGRRGIEAAAACAKNTGATLNADNWRESFRYALTGAPSCNSLRRMLFPAEVPETTVQRLLRQGKALSGGLWIDALVKGSHLVR
jgi:hypothetical protein